MAINLDGIVLHDAEISVSSKDSVFIKSGNEDLLLEAEKLPFNTHRTNKVQVVIWVGGTDAIALAERIATSWESEGFKVNRLCMLNGEKTSVQSFVLV